MVLERDIFVKFQSIGGMRYIVKGNEAFELDEVGSLVWENLDGKTSLTQIAEKIAQKYSQDQKVVLEDVRLFANDLLSNGLVEEVK